MHSVIYSIGNFISRIMNKGNYYKDETVVKEYIKMAEGFNGRELIKKLKCFLPDDRSILEIGAGPGTDLEILSKSYEVTGSDYSQAFLDVLKAKLPDIDLLEQNAISLETNKKFDGIYSNKVLHCLTDDELHLSIQNQNRILNSQGVICHSFWNGTESEVHEGVFCNYHTISEIEKFVSEYFDVLVLEGYTEMEENDSILLIGKKKK